MIIRQKDRNLIITLAKENLKQELKILAYGSRVNGEAHDTSDLDLVLVSKNKEKMGMYLGFSPVKSLSIVVIKNKITNKHTI